MSTDGRGGLGALRWPLVMFVVSLLAGGTMVVFAEQFWTGVDDRYTREQRNLRASQTRYCTVDDEKQVISIYLPRYQLLAGAGVIGEERRLQWIETLRDVASELQLPALRYTIGSRGPLELPFARPPGTFEAHGSEMTLDIGLLHEGDLLRLFTALDQRVEGLFDVAGCSMTVRGTMPYGAEAFSELDMSDELVGARCQLRWLTLTAPAEAAGS